MCWSAGCHRLTKTKTLLEKVGWLSINQFIYYHSFLLLYNVMTKGEPEFNLLHLNRSKNKIEWMNLIKRCWSQKAFNVYKEMDEGIKNERKISIEI